MDQDFNKQEEVKDKVEALPSAFSKRLLGLIEIIKNRPLVTLACMGIIMVLVFYGLSESEVKTSRALQEERQSKEISGIEQAINPRAKWTAEILNEVKNMQNHLEKLIENKYLETKTKIDDFSQKLESLENPREETILYDGNDFNNDQKIEDLLDNNLEQSTTGSGKTNMLNELLPQIRKEHGRAIIVDLTGSFTDRFFDPKCDKILNPLQENSSAWLPWNDCHEIWDYNDIASSFSNYNPKLDDFFAKSAELVLAEGLRLDSKDIKKLINTILYANNKEFARIFKNSAVSGIISSSAPETSSGIQATISKNIEVLQHLKPKGEFSIRKWFTSTEGWLFITATPNQRVMLRPLNCCMG